MPIRAELRPLYPPHWRTLSLWVRFERAGGRCQECSRRHLTVIRCLPDGRWFDEVERLWRNSRGRPCPSPDMVDALGLRTTRVVLAAAHLDHNPSHNQRRNLKAFCQRCHMRHDRDHHRMQRWITYRHRQAIGDFFLGPYEGVLLLPSAALIAAVVC